MLDLFLDMWEHCRLIGAKSKDQRWPIPSARDSSLLVTEACSLVKMVTCMNPSVKCEYAMVEDLVEVLQCVQQVTTQQEENNTEENRSGAE